MNRTKKLFVAKTAVILGTIPVLIWAHEYGPDAGYSNVPRELGTCAQAGCHAGTANAPSNSGSVSVSLPGGTSYTPGVKQHLTVTISDPVTSQRAWGFQLTSRQASSTSTMAGFFESTDNRTLVMCAGANLFTQTEMDFGKSQTCPANQPLSYMEHSLTGYNATRGQTGSAKYEFDWTPPSSDVGNITLYLAGNAANGDLTQNGDHIYTTTVTLTPQAAGTPPAILAGGVVSLSDFGGFSSVAPGSWMEIFGANLSTGTRQWAGSDFNGNNAPTDLDQVKVTIGGQQAFVYYISPGQVDAQVPSNIATGQQTMTVSNPNGTSANYTITVNALQPGLLAPASFKIGGKQYVVAQHADGSFVLPPGSISGLNTTQAKPGETIVISGVGFGPVTTSSNQAIPAGQIVTAANSLSNPIKMDFGGTPATLQYFGLAPNFVGLYQFNVVVPSIANNDAVQLNFTLNGAAGSQSLFTAVKQ